MRRDLSKFDAPILKQIRSSRGDDGVAELSWAQLASHARCSIADVYRVIKRLRRNLVVRSGYIQGRSERFALLQIIGEGAADASFSRDERIDRHILDLVRSTRDLDTGIASINVGALSKEKRVSPVRIIARMDALVAGGKIIYTYKKGPHSAFVAFPGADAALLGVSLYRLSRLVLERIRNIEDADGVAQFSIEEWSKELRTQRLKQLLEVLAAEGRLKVVFTRDRPTIASTRADVTLPSSYVEVIDNKVRRAIPSSGQWILRSAIRDLTGLSDLTLRRSLARQPSAIQVSPRPPYRVRVTSDAPFVSERDERRAAILSVLDENGAAPISDRAMAERLIARGCQWATLYMIAPIRRSLEKDGLLYYRSMGTLGTIYVVPTESARRGIGKTLFDRLAHEPWNEFLIGASFRRANIEMKGALSDWGIDIELARELESVILNELELGNGLILLRVACRTFDALDRDGRPLVEECRARLAEILAAVFSADLQSGDVAA